jgi:hypothetical protein
MEELVLGGGVKRCEGLPDLQQQRNAQHCGRCGK